MPYTPLRLHRARDPLWFCFAALLGLGCLRLPLLIAADDSTRKVIGDTGFFFAGALLGFARPDRVWRWGIASVLLIPAIDLSTAINPAIFPSPSMLDCVPWLLSQTPKYIVRALPAILGAYLGAYWSKS